MRNHDSEGNGRYEGLALDDQFLVRLGMMKVVRFLVVCQLVLIRRAILTS